MLDNEISNYLKKHGYVVEAQDCIMKVFNTSNQIIDNNYDSATSIMTITTPDNIFRFKWILGSPEEEK